MSAFADINELHCSRGDEGVREFLDATHERDHSRARGPAPIAPRPRFYAFTESELEAMAPPQMLVEDVLPVGGLTSVYGQYGCGKSFFALDLARSVETGALWRGKLCRQGLVIYIAAEGGNGFRQRLKAIRQTRPDLAYGSFRLITACPDLGTRRGDLAELIDSIEGAAASEGESPVLIVIDTLAQTLAGENENGDGMTAFIFNCQGLQQAFPGAAILAVHHVGHEGTRPRGHSSFMGALDAAIVVRADPETPEKYAVVTKMKDGESGARYDFELDQVQLGYDDGGRLLTSCIVRHTTQKAAAANSRGPVRRTKTQAEMDMNLALKVLREALETSTEKAPDGHLSRRHNSKVVTRDAWRDATYAAGFRAEDEGGKRRTAFWRAASSLYADNLAQEQDGLVWLQS